MKTKFVLQWKYKTDEKWQDVEARDTEREIAEYYRLRIAPYKRHTTEYRCIKRTEEFAHSYLGTSNADPVRDAINKLRAANEYVAADVLCAWANERDGQTVGCHRAKSEFDAGGMGVKYVLSDYDAGGNLNPDL